MKKLLFFTLVLSCNQDYEKLSTTRVKPPVEASLPSKVVASSLTSLSFSAPTLAETDYKQTCQTDTSLGDVCQDFSDGGESLMCIVKQRLFCDGPTQVLKLLDSLDGRLVEIEKRSEEGEVACVQESAVDRTSQMSFPGSESFTQKYQCQDADAGFAFGESGGTWYLRDGKSSVGQVFSVTSAGVVDGYMWLATDGSFSKSTGLFQIHADKANNTFEMTGGGVGVGFCAMHFHSDVNYIYLLGNPDGVGGSCDYDADGTPSASDWVEICIDVTTMTKTDDSLCENLKSGKTMTTLIREQADVTASGASHNVEAWEAAAPAPGGLSTTPFHMINDLDSLRSAAGNFSGIPEFKAEEKGAFD